MPFSDRMSEAMSVTDGSLEKEPERADNIDAVFFLVTILEIGVVKNLEHAPANAPTLSSSRTGSEVACAPCF